MPTLVTNVGKAITARRLKGATPTQMEPIHGAWGTGAGATAVTDTTLFIEGSEARVSGTSSIVTTTNADDTYQNVFTLTTDAAKTITNVGLFDAATVGNLFLKGDFTGLSLDAGESITFTIRAQVT